MHWTLQRVVKPKALVLRKYCSKIPKLPEEPTTCCMSGCANCVWIEYAEKVKEILSDRNSHKATQIILDKIQDPNMKAFLSMELASKLK